MTGTLVLITLDTTHMSYNYQRSIPAKLVNKTPLHHVPTDLAISHHVCLEPGVEVSGNLEEKLSNGPVYMFF